MAFTDVSLVGEQVNNNTNLNTGVVDGNNGFGKKDMELDVLRVVIIRTLLRGMLPTSFLVWTNFWQFFFCCLYSISYVQVVLKFEIICILHCQVMEDFIKLPPYLHDLYSLL